MIVGLLRVLLKVVLTLAVVFLSLMIMGDYLRQLVPESYHRAVWLSGLIIFFPCALGVALFAQSRPSKQPRYEKLLIVGAFVGAILFALFVTDVECTLTPSGRGGSSLHCKYNGPP
ncbi:MAG TPA: hypothetical protein VJT80_07830 [Steroidobacteraceae bacterium]|nr:hypothetical protein [Steroidobacteraceae bacterium]